MWRRCLLAAVSGGLLILTFPKFDLDGLVWLALVPLLVAVALAGSLKEAFLMGGLAGVLQFTGMLSWIPYPLIHHGRVSEWPAAGLLLLLSSYLALYVGLFALLLFAALRSAGRGLIAVLAPCAWVAFEFARNHLPAFGFPWCLLGYSQVNRLPLMQVADITGIYGISFLIVAINASIAACILSRPSSSAGRRKSLIFFGGAAILFFLIWGYGYLSLREVPASARATIPIAALQANVPFSESMEPYRKAFYQTYPRMMEDAAAKGHSLIVWPESPTPFDFHSNAAYRRHLMEMAKQSGVWLLFNNTTRGRAPNSEPCSTPPSPMRDENTEAYFNSALLLSPRGELVTRYDKTHLVPFGEYVPWRSLLPFAGKFLQEISDFRPGLDWVVSNIGQARFGTVICFEVIFPDLVRHFPLHGAEFLINLTNDAWYGDTASPYQHLRMAIVRAIENRRYLVRAANSGISAIIDPYGRVLQSTVLFQEAILSARVPARADLTFYTRFGDVFAWICVIIALGIPLGGFWRGGGSGHD